MQRWIVEGRQDNAFLTLEEVHVRRANHARKMIRDYLLLDDHPELKQNMDLRLIGERLKDHELMLENFAEDEWLST